MKIILLLAILMCAACIAAGLLVPALRPLAVSGSAAPLFLVCLLWWWALIYFGVGSDLPRGPPAFSLISLHRRPPQSSSTYSSAGEALLSVRTEDNLT